ncbi:hypothetical protein JCM16303_005786 [Sporobolomyces ruberrimus]
MSATPITPPSFHSTRLVYRSIESPLDDAFLLDLLGSDEPSHFGGTDDPVVPWKKKSMEDFQKAVEKAPIGVIICLAGEKKEGEVGTGGVRKAGEAIGVMILHPIRQFHRRADFGISIAGAHQGKGYAAEALNWLLDRAFLGYGLNKVQGACFSFNEKALKCYKSVGFVEEGRRRQATWQEGAYYDDVLIGILASEWFALREKKRKSEAEQAQSP